MDKSGIRTETKFEAGFAHPLRLDGTKFVDGPLMNPSILFGAANLYSTLNDFGKFDQALYSEKLLSKATLEAMFTPNFDRYGLGFAIRQWEGKRVVLHNGNITGFSARISRYIDQGVSIIVLENLREAPVTEVTEKLATAYFGWAAR
jgi:CubicO group peptidase (beta-lactamase class C family)